ncbi:MAG: PH domain-containing protein [Clostridia bacterium]|nr:PH domain-containing protein [Clostridia bacterium]
MGRYVEQHLYENELIVEKAKRDRWPLFWAWFFGVLCFWLLFVPTVIAIVKTVKYNGTEFVITNKRIIYKTGVFRTQSSGAPLNKITSVTVDTTFWGKIFNVYKIRIHTNCGFMITEKIERGDDFKSTLMGQIDAFEMSRLASQANWTARAMNRYMEK